MNKCCGRECVLDGGRFTCVECGRVGRMALSPSIQSYEHFVFEPKSSYSRYRRCKQLLNKLTGRGGAISCKVIKCVKKRKPKTCSEVFAILQKLKMKLLPYEQASTVLFYCTGERPMVLSIEESELILNQFKILYSLWIDHGTVKWFPYNWLLRQLCGTQIIQKRLGFCRAKRLKGYIKPLKCVERREKYNKQWDFLVKKIMQSGNVEGNHQLFEISSEQ